LAKYAKGANFKFKYGKKHFDKLLLLDSGYLQK